MAELVTDGRTFRSDEAWGSRLLTQIAGAEAHLMWTDRPYRWHVNRSNELFMVLDGRVEMKVRSDGEERSHWLQAGDMMTINAGEEHVAHPDGEARILVVGAAE